jgi:7-carboxy-7-deazaguanine synthase
LSPSLQVVEHFVTIQGEGTDAGRPCFLVRLGGCNLRCSYCDTRYAWNRGNLLPADDLVALATRIGVSLICVTGGEPLLQRHVSSLIGGLLDHGFDVSVETNGSLPIRRVPTGARRVMDIKTPGSGWAGSFYAPNLQELGPRDQIKFVLVDRRDYVWARRRMGIWRLGEHGEEILMSPVHGVLDPGRLGDWILADGLPVRLQIQLHKHLWPGQRR